jgi:type IV pilus assembly protein PilC
MLYQQVDTKNAKAIVGEVYESIQGGRTLSEAFKEQQGLIPNIMVSMVAAGEESGRLDEVMERLAEHFQKAQKLKNKMSSAMVYPKILAFVTFAVSWGLLTFLVPSITTTIADLGGELPGLTKAIIAISDSITHFWYIYLVVIVGGYSGFKMWRASEKGQYQWAWLMIHMPIVGNMTKMTATAQFTRTVSTLLKSGISVLQAVEITEKSLDNVILEKKLADARVEIRKGAALSKSIKGIEEFPPMVYAMVAIGEESGTLDTILDKAADYFEDEADAATSKMTAALEPIMIIVMAVIVGLIVGGIAIPIFNMASYI